MTHHHCTCCGSTPAADNCATRYPLKEYGHLILSALLLATGIVLMNAGKFFSQHPGLAVAWFVAAYLPVGLPVLREAWENIRRRDLFNEFTLMTIASIGAFYIGEYPEGVAVMLFYSLGEYFQSKAVSKAKHDISALLDVRPEVATVVEDRKAFPKNPRQVQPGETIEVKVGERVPLDGTLLTDMASFNTSALTGESLPRHIRQGEEVLSGMIVTDRVTRIRVTRPFEQSALTRILELVQHASGRKAPAELFIRKFARIYTPAVTGLAVLLVLIPWIWSLADTNFVFSFNEWLYRALAFLVISCPCALVVSIPLGYFGGIGAASRLGILFKGGNYLDAMVHINTVVFDKTGTLTQGTFEVRSCQTCKGLSDGRMVQLLASAEYNSTHPIAKAIVHYANREGISLLPAKDIRESGGQGLEACVDGIRVLAGNAQMLEQHNVCFPQDILDKAEGTAVLCALDGKYAGCLVLSDVLKKDAVQAVKDLKALNIKNIQMLSGDKQSIVTAFARKLGITRAYGDLLPEGKVKHLEELRKDARNRIAFVGDGINDAPVLALSHVGIAMGGLGSDAAIETADVVIQTDQPSKVATAIRAGKATRHIVWQNITLALGIKILVLLLGAAGLANLWEAVFADVGVALIAIMNAMRVQRLIK